MTMKFAIVIFALTVLAACGDKVPESKAAKEVGNVPKQTMDKAVTGVENAMTQGAERLKDDEAKK
jgi:hypothetical protein